VRGTLQGFLLVVLLVLGLITSGCASCKKCGGPKSKASQNEKSNDDDNDDLEDDIADLEDERDDIKRQLDELLRQQNLPPEPVPPVAQPEPTPGTPGQPGQPGTPGQPGNPNPPGRGDGTGAPQPRERLGEVLREALSETATHDGTRAPANSRPPAE